MVNHEKGIGNHGVSGEAAYEKRKLIRYLNLIDIKGKIIVEDTSQWGCYADWVV